MRHLLILLLFSLINSKSFTQTSQPIFLDWFEDWIFLSNGEKINTLSFTRAAITEENNWLPEFTHLQPINSNGGVFSVEFIDTGFTLLSSTEKQILRNKSIQKKINTKIQLVTIKKQNYLQVKFIPIRKNTETGQIEKLEKFTLRFKRVGQTKSTQLKKTYATKSILQTGKWIKVSVDTSAVHKITYAQLLEMGINNPQNIRIYGSGGMLPKMNSEKCLDDLPVTPIYIEKGNDGVFNNGDYLLFYAKGPRSWTFDDRTKQFIHQNHHFSDVSYYFLSSDFGSPVQIQSLASLPTENVSVQSFDDFRVIDHDNINLLKSGRLWLGEEFDITTKYSFRFSFPNLTSSEPLEIVARTAARSSSSTNFKLLSGSKPIGEIDMPSVNIGSYTAIYASLKEKSFSGFIPSTDNFQLNLNYEKSSASSKGWLDFLRVTARRRLVFSGDQMAFRDSRTIGEGNKALFSIQNTNSTIQIWDVTESETVKSIAVKHSVNTSSFIANSSNLREYIAFDPNGNFPTVKFVEDVANQNLHGINQADMIIISPSKFISYAGQIADFHKEKDDLSTIVVTPDDIYNEFSSGSPDVSAIRNFVKMLYDRANTSEERPKYLLLFGDGSYDNKSNTENNSNQILTYQSENSLSPTQSFVTDDFFGLLDDNEGEALGMVDIGIGRLPVNNSEEAQIVTSKIINYNNSEWGNWRNTICFIGDDEDNNIHMRDANRLAVLVENDYPQYHVQRIFLDDFEQISSSSGQEYPEVNRKIGESVNKGTLLMNYTGHGNENGLAHEQILMLDDILAWKNPTKLPLFMTATCEFSRFDNYKKTSVGEMILLRENGGGIGLFTTTRLVFSSPNFTLNRNFYHNIFKRNSKGNFNRLGDIMRKTKNETGTGINKRNFTLLGDPALQLNYPMHNVQTLQINDVNITQPTDTLKALSKVKISGQIVNNSGQELTDFYGTVFPTVIDKPTNKATRGNDGIPFNYKEQSNVLFKGKASISKGKFHFHFFVPKDINYQFGNGKISYYANSTNSDASGYTNSIIIGGTNPNAEDDKTGPEIELFMNDEQFAPGGITNSSPLLLALVQDASGINTVGNTIGHDIIAILDQKTDQPIDLNDFYESDLDDYQKGKIYYQLNKLEVGEHEVKVKIWDNANNSSEAILEFIVADDADFALKNILNYPNPFTTNTCFYFEHNKNSHELDVMIQILTISGKLIKTIETNIASSGNRVGPIQWDGKDDFGNSIGRGVYFYRVRVRSDDGKVANKFQKLVILR